MANLTDIIAFIVIWLNIIIGTLLLIFGLVGNCLNVYVFTRPTYRNATAVRYLLAGSVASCIQLINTLLLRILTDGFQVSIGQSNDRYCQSHTLIAFVASLCAITYPCWASFDQFISTSRNPIIRLQWNSKRFVNPAIFSTMIFWIIVYIPSCIFIRSLGSNCIYINQILNFIYSYGIIPIGYCILPIILLTYFNIGIVKNLRDAPVIIVSNINKRMARQVHRMLVPQLIILILSGLPFVSQTLYATATASIVKGTDRLAIENLIGQITRLLFYLNYISSFYIYVITSNEFRRIIQNIPSRHATITVVPNV
jgi:hypothetical protein